ncbi:MAG: hypothetical protein Q4D62_00085 [Planctomycetia bacterium]|nr:hypothetical protein [Planctomycetia bacterium]
MKRNLLTSYFAWSLLLSAIFWVPATTYGQRGGPPGNSRGSSPSARPAPSNRPSPSARPTSGSRPSQISGNRPSSPSRLEGTGRPSSRPQSAVSSRPVSRPNPGMTSRPGTTVSNRPVSRPTLEMNDRPPQRPGSGSTADRPGNRPSRPDYDRPPQRPDYGRPSSRPDYNRPPQYSRPEGYRPPSRPPYPHYAGHQPHYHHPAPPPPPRPAPRYYYPYDPYRYYGWGPVYRPYYPWWIGAANFGAGFAMGYTVGSRPLYYYYPDYVVTPSTTTVVIENNTIVQEEPVENEVIWNPPDDILEDVENPIWEENVEPVQVSKPVSVLNRDLNLSNNTDLSKITKEMIDDSWKTIQEADTQFSAGEVREAIQGYNKVIDNVPVMPDPWFRLAFAEVSQKEYNAAMDHCLKGMELSRNWPASPFSLDYMYQENQTKKAEDLNFLEKTLRTAPDNSDLNMLAGMAFYSDGQSEKAVEYLTKAKNLMPDLVDFVDPMLKNIEESGKKEGEK